MSTWVCATSSPGSPGKVSASSRASTGGITTQAARSLLAHISLLALFPSPFPVGASDLAAAVGRWSRALSGAGSGQAERPPQVHVLTAAAASAGAALGAAFFDIFNRGLCSCSRSSLSHKLSPAASLTRLAAGTLKLFALYKSHQLLCFLDWLG